MNPLSSILAGVRKRQASSQGASREVRFQVSNLNRQTVLATCMELADSGPKRNKGLLGRKLLNPGEGLWIVPCESVHTFFMQFPIDLVYLDREHRIKKLRSGVPPWRLSACLSAHSVLEFPAGTIHNTNTKRGDKLEFTPASMASDNSRATDA